MAQFGVNLAKLRAALTDLRTERGHLTTKIGDLQTSEKTLSGKWEGDAKAAFEKAFNSDVKYMNSFVELVTKYEEALEKVIESYSNAESQNILTGTTRSFGSK